MRIIKDTICQEMQGIDLDDLDSAATRIPPPSSAKKKADPVSKGACNANPKGMSFIKLILEDFSIHERSLTSQGFLTLLVHRFGNWRMGRRKCFRVFLTPIYHVLQKTCEITCGIQISYCVPVGRRLRLEHFGGMIISARSIGNDVTIRQNTTIGISSKADVNARPTIEDGVDIGCNSVIIGDIVVGRGSVIGAGSVVIRDVPAFCVVAGVPAKVVRTLEPPLLPFLPPEIIG